MYRRTSEKLNVTLLGDSLCDMRFLLAMTSQEEELMRVICDSIALHLCFEFRTDIRKKDGCVILESADLTAADAQTAENDLSRLMEAALVQDKRQYVAQGIEQHKEKKYRKLIQLSCPADAEKLTEIVSDETLARGINELTLVFEASALVSEELRRFNEKHGADLSSLCIRTADDIMAMMGHEQFKAERPSLKSALHRIMANSDALILFEDRYRYNEEQQALIKCYLKTLPAVGFKLTSDLLNEKFEDLTDDALIREKYLGTVERRRISCDGIKALFDSVYAAPVMGGSLTKFICCAGASGFDNNNKHLFDVLAAASVGIMANAFAEFYFKDLSGSAAALEASGKSAERRLTAVPENSDLTPERLTEFLHSDRPLLSPNGGIAIKSHGKLKFPESCQLAHNAYEFLLAAIKKADVADELKALLKIELMHFTDAYSSPDGNKIINRSDYVKAVESTRNNSVLSKEILSAFLSRI